MLTDAEIVSGSGPARCVYCGGSGWRNPPASSWLGSGSSEQRPEPQHCLVCRVGEAACEGIADGGSL